MIFAKNICVAKEVVLSWHRYEPLCCRQKIKVRRLVLTGNPRIDPSLIQNQNFQVKNSGFYIGSDNIIIIKESFMMLREYYACFGILGNTSFEEK